MATTTPQTAYAHINKDPKVCGGNACIDGTRIRVMDVVCLLQEGYTPEQMLNVFSAPLTLTLGQVHAALAYYYDHQDEIEEAFAEEDEIDADTERRRAEFLKRRTKP